MKLNRIAGFTVLLLFLIPSWAKASGELRNLGSKEASIGLTGVSISNVFSAYNNQAGLAFLDGPAIGLQYTSIFATGGLNEIGFVGAIPIKKGAFGISVDYFGYSKYNETKIGLSYSLKLAEKVSLGAQLDYLGARTAGYGSKNFFTFEIGILAKPIEKLSIGAHVFNPIPYSVDEFSNEKLSTVLSVGATYFANEDLFLSLEFEKEIDSDFRIKGGINYDIIELLSLRAGFATKPILATFGVGLNIVESLHIDIGSTYHLQLGFSPTLALSYEF